MKISFVILHYKTPHHLRLCVQSIQDLGLSMEHEVIVVDNASGDDSGVIMHRDFPSVIFIQSDENTGHTKGNNIGLQRATGEYVIITNPDILYKSAKDIEDIIEYMDTNTKVGILGPKLRNPDGTVQNSCYRKYSTLTPLFRRTALRKLPFAKKDIERHLMSDFAHDETKKVDWVLGACMVLRKSMIEKIGVLSESFFLYFGDYEYCDRARRGGFDVIYFHRSSNIIHYHKRESVTSKFSFVQAFSYITRVHIKDWFTYLRISKK